MKADLKKMSDGQLQKLIKEIEAEVKSRAVQKIADARKAAEAAARKHGFSLSDLIGGKSKKSKSTVAPKYRNPADKSQTWSGRGRQPAWFKSALAAGKKAEDMAI